MKRGIKCEYTIMKRGLYGVYFEPIFGRKIILKKGDKLLYVGYRKNGKWFEFTDLETGFLIDCDTSYTAGIVRVFIDFDKWRCEIDKTKQRFLKEVKQMHIANEIYGYYPLLYNESLVINNEQM